MCRFIPQLHGIFADQLAALIVAAARQGLEMEAPPGQRQYADARRIQQQCCILWHPSRGDDVADAKVTFVDADQVGELRVIGSISPAASQETVYLSLLVATDDDQIDVPTAVVPHLSEHIVDLVLVKSGAGGKAAVACVQDIRREVLDYALNLGFETIFLNTNGTLLEKDVSCRLAAYDRLSVSVSLDGPQALHDHIRGEGSYKRTVECIEKAVDAGIDLFIFTTASKSLIQDLPYFADQIYKKFHGLNCLTLIQLIRVTNDTFDLSKELLEPDDFLKLVWMASLLNLYGLKIYVLNNPLAGVTSKLLNTPWLPQSRPLYCDGSLIVMANRDIALSHSTRDSFGKYEPGMIEKVLVSDAYRNAIAPDKETCPTCRYHRECRGNGMVRPSEWFRDMQADVPYCKRVLDRAAQW